MYCTFWCATISSFSFLLRHWGHAICKRSYMLQLKSVIGRWDEFHVISKSEAWITIGMSHFNVDEKKGTRCFTLLIPHLDSNAMEMLWINKTFSVFVGAKIQEKRIFSKRHNPSFDFFNESRISTHENIFWSVNQIIRLKSHNILTAIWF